MELDQRVKALEYEIKILKNEIQRTLLDIQEQVLIHYYPTLRADDSLPPEAIAQAFSAKQSAAATGATAGGPAPVSTPVPAVKKVSLDDIRAQNEAVAPVGAAVPARTASEQSVMINLSEWVSGQAPKIGGERVGKIVEVCGNKGIIPPETKAVLTRIASLSKEAAPDKVPVNEILNALLKLDGILGRAADVEEALALIEEAQLG